jgi:hypothetical protein
LIREEGCNVFPSEATALDPVSAEDRGSDTRRRVRATPQVVPLEDRALPSGSAVQHAVVGARPIISAEFRADRAYVTSLYHDLLRMAPPPACKAHWVHLLKAGMSREQVRLAFLALPQYHRLLAIEQPLLSTIKRKPVDR